MASDAGNEPAEDVRRGTESSYQIEGINGLCNLNCCSTIQGDEIGIVEKFGKFDRLAPPGLLCLPIPCMCVRAGTLNTRQQTCPLRLETKTKDDVFAHIALEIQYVVNKYKAFEAFYRLVNVEQQIRSNVADVVRATICTRTLDEIFNDKFVVISAVRERVSAIMETFGFYLVSVLVNEITPARKVSKAMNQIEQYKRLRDATQDQAEAQKIILVKRAEAEAQRKYLQGIGISRQRKAIINGVEETMDMITSAGNLMKPQDVLELMLITNYFETLKDMGMNDSASTIYVASSPVVVSSTGKETSNLRKKSATRLPRRGSRARE